MQRPEVAVTSGAGWLALLGGDEAIACLVTAATAALLAWAAVPLARRLARRVGAIDVPRGRHVHRQPTPRFGGLALLLALWAGTALGAPWLSTDRLDVAAVLPILGAGTLVCLVGACDDVRELRPLHKLLGIAIAATLLVLCGVRVEELDLPLLGKLHVGILGSALTVVWLLACTNAVNLIDGVDGLGAGVSLVAAGGLAAIALGIGDPVSALLLCAIAGSCAGFLLHNREPARIFLGDSGSLLLGFLLAAVSAHGGTKRATALFLVAALCALALPLFDSTHAFVRRFRKALTQDGQRRLLRALRATAVGDRDHLHHRLLSRGLSHRQVARTAALTTLLTTLVGMLLLPTGDVGLVTVAGGVLAGAFALRTLARRVAAAPGAGAEVTNEPLVVLQPPGRSTEPTVVLPSLQGRTAGTRRTADGARPGVQVPRSRARSRSRR